MTLSLSTICGAGPFSTRVDRVRTAMLRCKGAAGLNITVAGRGDVTAGGQTMGEISERLAALGLTLPEAPKAVASYVPAKRVGDLVWTSGQLPFVDGKLPWTGAVDGAVSVEAARDAARQAALNAMAVAASQVGGVDGLLEVVRVVGYVQSGPDFHAQPEVVNGASLLFEQVFGANGRHARAAVGVSALPLDAPVEIEVLFRVRPTP
jgi:enamine deaminase RidA (YjgF/YER057c/UK114 family)